MQCIWILSSRRDTLYSHRNIQRQTSPKGPCKPLHSNKKKSFRIGAIWKSSSGIDGAVPMNKQHWKGKTPAEISVPCTYGTAMREIYVGRGIFTHRRNFYGVSPLHCVIFFPETGARIYDPTGDIRSADRHIVE